MFKDYTKYEIYEDGRIWSYSRNKFLKPKTDDGYQRVHLTDNEGKQKWYLVHRVVYEAVTRSPIPEGLQVNHINEIKTDNRFENLNLMTQKENINWGTRTERAIKSISKARINNPKRSKAVGAFKNSELVIVFASTQEAGRQGFNQSAVVSCCNNCFNREGNNVYKGFEWRYL